MAIIEIILYLLAYTIGIITLFLEIICYSKKIELLETIAFTAAFLFFIVTLSITIILGGAEYDDSSPLSSLVLISMVLLGLTIPLNIFAERRVTIPNGIRTSIYSISFLLIVAILAKAMNIFDYYTQNIVIIFLAFSILFSMVLIRKTKPEKRVLHREKSERKFSLFILILIPIGLFFIFGAPLLFPDFMSGNRISLTPPIIFIYLSSTKLLEDLNRLSLFKNENTILEQNAKNFNLTPREQEISDLLVKGHSYAKISESLFIAMPTVKSHVSNIYKKVNVKNKIELLNALIN